MKKRVLLIAGSCILLLLGVFTFHRMTNDNYQTLPLADGLQIIIVSNRDTRIDGELGVESKTYAIPKDTELFTEYSTLLNSLELRRCRKDYEMGGHYYLISYSSGSPGDSKGVRILFNEDENDIYFHVLITQNREDPILYNSTCKAENMEEWRKEFRKLLEKSEIYRRD